jgi:spore germination protein
LTKNIANSITNRQMVFLIILFLTSYSTIDLPKVMAEKTGRSSWILILTASVVFGIAAVFITKLNNLFPGKVFVDYCREITGKFISFLIIMAYLLYAATIGIYLSLKMAITVQSNFLPKTPQAVILFVGILLFSYVSYKGITNVARMLEIIGALFLLVTVGICVIILVQGMTYNILPFFNKSDVKSFLPAIKDLATPFTGLGILFVVPFTVQNKNAPKAAFFTLLFIGLLYVLIVESTIMALGINNTIVMNDAFIEAVKITEMPVIERMDIFYLTFGLSSLFAGISVAMLGVVEVICRFCTKISRYIMVIIIGSVFFILCLLGLDIKSKRDVIESFAPYLTLFTSILGPIVLFVIAKIRKRSRKTP